MRKIVLLCLSCHCVYYTVDPVLVLILVFNDLSVLDRTVNDIFNCGVKRVENLFTGRRRR